jgi:peptidoglycan hydrolase-like protein with peptidoglycan-binding domain
MRLFNYKLTKFITKGLLLCALAVTIAATSTTPAIAATYNNCSGTSRPTLKVGDNGSCVTLAQRKLAAKGAFHAGYTTTFGPVTKAAVLQVQRNAGIAQDGIIGPVTWNVLDSAGATSATTPAPNPASSATQLPSSCLTNTKTICVVKVQGSHATLYAVQNKAIVKSFAVRTGDARGASYATTNGTYSVGRRYIDYKSKSYNNAPMPYSLFFNGGQAIHYSADFAANGYGGAGASHGCVNVGSLSNAKWLYDWSPIYTRVVVTKG